MIFAEHKRIWNEIDEIDHLTIRYRQQIEIDSRKAAELMRRYITLDTDTAQALALPREALDAEALAARPQEELAGLLVAVRDVLLRKSGL